MAAEDRHPKPYGCESMCGATVGVAWQIEVDAMCRLHGSQWPGCDLTCTQLGKRSVFPGVGSSYRSTGGGGGLGDMPPPTAVESLGLPVVDGGREETGSGSQTTMFPVEGSAVEVPPVLATSDTVDTPLSHSSSARG